MALKVGRQAERTVLKALRHEGPVRLQKLFWPEGASPAHAILLHPPGAMAGGDTLELDVQAEEGSGLVITTPGAGKWYRSRSSALQRMRFRVANGACIEWMPQETLVHDGARMDARSTWELAAGARAAALDILVFGRRESGERCKELALTLASRIEIAGRLAYLDRVLLGTSANFPGVDLHLKGAAVLGEHHVSGLLWAYAPEFGASPDGASRFTPLHDALETIFTTLEALGGENLHLGASCLPCGLVLVRAVGSDTEPLRKSLQQAWSLLRPLIRAKAACVPRIWNT